MSTNQVEQQIEKQSEDGFPRIDNIVKQVQEVLVPAELLPSTIPSLQRLQTAPEYFFVVKVSFNFGEYFYYFLTDGEAIIDLERNIMFYRTRKGRIYKIPISRRLLPKALNVYAKGIRISITQNITTTPNVIYVEGEGMGTIEFSGDIESYHPLYLTVSILFHIMPYLPSI